jgi:hypothetical protein
MVLERWTNPKLSRRTCSPRYGLRSWRGKSAGVAKRPRERSPTEIRTVTIRNFGFAVRWWQRQKAEGVTRVRCQGESFWAGSRGLPSLETRRAPWRTCLSCCTTLRLGRQQWTPLPRDQAGTLAHLFELLHHLEVGQAAPHRTLVLVQLHPITTPRVGLVVRVAVGPARAAPVGVARSCNTIHWGFQKGSLKCIRGFNRVLKSQ